MKISLPGFLKPGKANAKAPSPEWSPPDEIKPVSLGKVRGQLLVAGLVLPLVPAVIIYVLMSGSIGRALEREASVTTGLLKVRVASVVDYYSTAASSLASDPEVAALLEAGNEAPLRSRADSLRFAFPAALNVRFLRPGIMAVDLQASPPLSYATLAQMRLAESGSELPPVEVNRFNTPQQHINIVRPVMAPSADSVAVGHVMLSLSNDVLQDLFADLPPIDGYIELQQAGEKGAPVRLVSHGDADARQGEAGHIVPVEGSRWQLAYWPATGGSAHPGGDSLWLVGAALLSAGIMVVMVFAGFRSLSKALRLDEERVVSLVDDFHEGQLEADYPLALDETRDTIGFMIRTLNQASAKSDSWNTVSPEPDAEAVTEEQTETPLSDDHWDDVVADFEQGITTDNLFLEDDPLDIQLEQETVAIDPSIFRAYDIRGVVNQTLTAGAVELIGRAIGSEALQRGRDTVVVGRDGRLSGPDLSAALIAGITSTGCDVKDIGCVPTPVLYFATYILDTGSGVIVTGSHNPPDYNGLKIMIDGETLSGESIQSLRERIEAANFISGQGRVQAIDVLPDYIERINGDVSLERPLRVVVDCGNGVAGGVAPQLLRGLGCEVTELFCEVDGTFPNHHPDPSKAENLADLIAAVDANQADIGLAFDGDGDRLGVVTSAGQIIWPDRVLMLYARDILDRNPGGKIIYDVKCTRFLDALIREHGGEPLMWKTGHSFIKAKLRESGALLAGEMSGHIFIKERWYGFDDGLYAGARLLEILARDPRPSATIFAELPDSVNTPELNVEMQEGEPPVFVERLLEKAHFEGATVSTIDGLRADFEDGWGLVRASNTTPVLVLRFEADNQEALARIMDEFRRVLLQVDASLSLPF